MKRFKTAIALGALVAIGLSSAAQAQSWPTKPGTC